MATPIENEGHFDGPHKDQDPRRYVRIDGVPVIKRKKIGMCGYESLAMVLQYWWGGNLTNPTELKQQFIGKHSPENYSRWQIADQHPTALGLIDLANDTTTQPVARLIAGKAYNKLGDPHRVLKIFLENGIPCIVRTPYHFKVAIGFNEVDDTYTFNDPAIGEIVQSRESFDDRWKQNDKVCPDDTSYLILAIFPKDRTRHNNLE